MTGVLSEIFEELNQRGVSWCLLRELPDPREPRHIRELDMLVAPQDLARLAEALSGRGFVSLPSWGHEPHHFFVAYDPGDDAWWKFDVVTEVRCGTPVRALRVAAADDWLRCRERQGQACFLAPEHEFIKRMLHCLVHRQDFGFQHYARLTELGRQLAADPAARAPVEQVLAPAISWPMIVRAMTLRYWQLLNRRRGPLVRQLFWRDPLGSIWRFLGGLLLLRLRPFLVALRHRGLLVALLAPDGAGKTTLAQGLTGESFLRARPIYMGGNFQASTVALPTTKWLRQWAKSRYGQRGKLVRMVVRVLSFASLLAEQWYRGSVALYHRLRGRVVVFDRYIYDGWLNNGAPTPWKRLRRRLFEAGCPTPDLVFLLDAPGDVLYRRKGQHSPEWLERQRCAYRALRERLPQIVEIDATREPGEVRRAVTSLVWHRYAALRAQRP